jgi:hypothetical protein
MRSARRGLRSLIPILYLQGISTGEFEEAMIALLGKDAGGLSARPLPGKEAVVGGARSLEGAQQGGLLDPQGFDAACPPRSVSKSYLLKR